MDFNEQLSQFSARVEKLKNTLSTEEATKTSLILPFFQILGYDVFNPFEFIPEYTADTGTKKGEKVDYAILKNGEPLILIEAKSVNTELSLKHMNQLFRYFTVTKAKFAILTNGIIYRFYSDLEESNKMDSIPFLEIDLLDLKDDSIKHLKKFQKNAFDLKGILDSASDLKYITLMKKVIVEQIQNPSDQLVKTLLSKEIYSGVKTQTVLDKFRDIIKIAFNDHINEVINSRLKNAINADVSFPETMKDKSSTELTAKEIEILDHIKGVLNTECDITYKKTSGYACMQIGNNSRKWICRVYLRQANNLFTLHKYDGVDYECEYYFDEVWQLDQISDIICDVFKRCSES